MNRGRNVVQSSSAQYDRSMIFMIGELYALTTLIMNMHVTSVVEAWPARSVVQSYRERTRNAIIVVAAWKHRGEIYIVEVKRSESAAQMEAKSDNFDDASITHPLRSHYDAATFFTYTHRHGSF